MIIIVMLYKYGTENSSFFYRLFHIWDILLVPIGDQVIVTRSPGQTWHIPQSPSLVPWHFDGEIAVFAFALFSCNFLVVLWQFHHCLSHLR